MEISRLCEGFIFENRSIYEIRSQQGFPAYVKSIEQFKKALKDGGKLGGKTA